MIAKRVWFLCALLFKIRFFLHDGKTIISPLVAHILHCVCVCEGERRGQSRGESGAGVCGMFSFGKVILASETDTHAVRKRERG